MTASDPWTDLRPLARGTGGAPLRELDGLASSGVQVSDYVRFEHHLTAANVAAGEQVRWLPRRRASDVALPGNDFWLFDEELIVFHHFDGNGELSSDGDEEVVTDPAVVKLAATAFESVWTRAVPHASYRLG